MNIKTETLNIQCYKVQLFTANNIYFFNFGTYTLSTSLIILEVIKPHTLQVN